MKIPGAMCDAHGVWLMRGSPRRNEIDVSRRSVLQDWDCGMICMAKRFEEVLCREP